MHLGPLYSGGEIRNSKTTTILVGAQEAEGHEDKVLLIPRLTPLLEGVFAALFVNRRRTAMHFAIETNVSIPIETGGPNEEGSASL